MAYDSREKVSKLFDIDPEFDRYVKENSVQLPKVGDVIKMRELRNQMEEWMNDGYTSSTRQLAMRDGHENEVRIFKPSKEISQGPLIILAHAGGFAMGTTRQLSPFARAFAELFGATVVCTTHRLAPEHVFPAAIHDFEDTVTWVVENASSLDADPLKGFIVGGVSSGAGLAAVLSQQWVESERSPRMTGVWCCMPCLLDDKTVPAQYADLFFSREQATSAILVDTENLTNAMAHCQPDVQSPLWSPFNAAHPHVGMPPVVVQVSGADPMRDDGLIYERALHHAGVNTRLHVYPGVPHWHFGFFPSLRASKQALVDAVRGTGWLLGQDAEHSDSTILQSMEPAY